VLTTLVERKQLPSGRAGVQHRDGFTFDAGPTVLTMPDPITDALWAASRDPSVNLNELMPMRRLDPAYRACFADRTIDVRSGREAMREEFAQTCGSVCAAAAPDGCSTLYVLEPVPKLNGFNWTTEAQPLRDRLHAFLATQGYSRAVITEQLVTHCTGKPRAWRLATHSRSLTPSARPDLSVHRTPSPACPGCSSPGRERPLESAYQWC
jgi:hypothetical protein